MADKSITINHASARIGKFVAYFEKNDNAIVLSILSLLIIAGILYSFILGDRLRFSDEKVYYMLATNLVAHQQFSLDGLDPTAVGAPGYPFILAGFKFIGASIPLLRLVNFLALALSAYILYRLLKNRFSSLAGVFAVVLILCYPVLFFTAGTLYAQIIGALMLIMVLALVSDPVASSGSYLAGGAIYGFLILTVPVFLLNLPVLVLSPWVLGQSRKWQKALLFLLTASLLVSCWTFRNYMVFNRFLLLTSHSGITFLYGNSPGAHPTSFHEVDDYRAETKDLDEVQRDHFYKSKAWEWIRHNPGQAIRLYCLKVLNYFNYRVELATPGESSPWKDLLMLITYGPLLLLLIIRLILRQKYPLSPLERYFAFLYISNAFLLSIFLIRLRLRLPFDFLLIAMAAVFLANLFQSHQNEHSPTPL